MADKEQLVESLDIPNDVDLTEFWEYVKMLEEQQEQDTQVAIRSEN